MKKNNSPNSWVRYDCYSSKPVPIKIPSKIEENHIKALWPVIIKYESAFAVRVGVLTGGTDWTVAVPASRKISVWAPMKIIIQWTTWRRAFQLTVRETHFSIIRRWLGISCEVVAADFHIIPFKLVPIYHLSIARIRMKERTAETRTDLFCPTSTCTLIVLAPNRWNGRSDSSASGWSNNSTPETQHVHVRNSTSISYLVINEQQKPWSRYLRTVPNPTTW